MFAVQTLFDIGRTDEAKTYLKKLVESKPNREALVALNKKFGSPLFFQLSRDHRLQPDSEQLNRLVRDAAYEAARDPARLRKLVQQLNDPSPVTRHESLEQLRGADTASLAPLFEALRDRQRVAEHPRLREAIVDLGLPMVEPVLGALDCPDPGLRAEVIRVLGRFRTPRAVPLLVGPYLHADTPAEVRQAAEQTLIEIVGQAPGQYETEQLLFHRAQELLEGALPGKLDFEDQVVIWQWDEQQKTSVQKRYPVRDAALRMAARLARDLYQISPEKADVRRQFLLVTLEAAKLDAGLNQPLPQGEGTAYAAAAKLGVAAVEDLLAFAAEHDHVPAAMAAAELLGQLGDARLLQAEGERPRPLALALQHGDRRLRMAAARAVMRIDPQQAYAGSSFLTEALDYAIRTVGSQRVLVAHPRLQQSQTLVGLLSQVGFEADSVRTGKEVFRQAADQPDYEFVLLSDAIDFPEGRETIQMLRRDPRTSRLPVGIMAREEYLRQAQQVTELVPLVLAFPRPHDAAGLAYQVDRLKALGGRERTTFNERLDQALEALDYFGHLAQAPQTYSFYDLFRHQRALQSALATPQLSEKAAKVLGRLGAPQAQRALVTLASQHARPLAARQAAAKAFAEAVQRHGILLTRSEIVQQYERYNLSEALDRDTQQVLAAILDTIEGPSKHAGGKSAVGPQASDQTPPAPGQPAAPTAAPPAADAPAQP
jgi:HEAT repeat protein